MFSIPIKQLLLLLSLAQAGLSSNDQLVLGKDHVKNPIAPASSLRQAHGNHVVPDHIVAALEAFSDPVDALVSLEPEVASKLNEPRLLQVFGNSKPEWMTEGDKMRLRRQGKKFMDITNHQEQYEQNNIKTLAGKANLPKLSHQRMVRSLFPKVSYESIYRMITHLTSFYNRLYTSPSGEASSKWLHEQVAKIIANAPYHTHISLESFTHDFSQTSTIARFEPKVRNFSKPLTIIGAHQDSANYMFPLLPAPGADDDGSGSVSILEAFRVLADSGFVPLNPVEFHWYAAEEAGLLGSQDIAAYKKAQGANIGAMMEFDMTAFIGRNATESIGFIVTEADEPLTNWSVNLSKEYSSIPTYIYKLPPGAGSDYMSFTKQGFPSAFASEGNPLSDNGFMGDFDPYVHTSKDTMDVDDDTGYFSIEHMQRFSELAIAFAVEQGGWDAEWRQPLQLANHQ